MPERGVGNDPPSVTVVDISDPAVAGQGIEIIDLDAVQLTSDPFRAKRVVVRLEGGAVVATHGTTTVSAVALDWGFWHFGEFSRAYKDCFGELPSDTLRRKPGARD